MNSDETSSITNRVLIARARRARVEEERQFLIRRALQSATADSSITAALLTNHSRRRSLLTSQRGFAGSITAESLAESYLQQHLSISTTSPGATTDLRPELNQLRLARSLTARLGSDSSPIRSALIPSAAAAQTGIVVISNTAALNQFPLSNKVQLTRDSHRLKRPRHEDLLSRTRETMVRKPGKNAKIGQQQLQEEKQGSFISPARSPAPPSATVPAKKRVVMRQQKPGFLLPPSAREYRQRNVGVRLDSYRSLWDKLGGIHGKERFQRRVQNGKVPIAIQQSPPNDDKKHQ